MDAPWFLKGLLLGFAIAAPVGPIGILCINRTLHQGRWIGFVSGLGAATADGLYGGIAGFGLAFVSRLLIAQQVWLRLLGGLFLCYLGVQIVRARPATNTNEATRLGGWAAYTSTLFLTLANPATIVSFAAAFAGLGLAGAAQDSWAAAQLIGGVFLGSASWWVLLSNGVGALGQRFAWARSRWINYFSGLLVASFGFLALASAARSALASLK